MLMAKASTVPAACRMSCKFAVRNNHMFVIADHYLP